MALEGNERRHLYRVQHNSYKNSGEAYTSEWVPSARATRLSTLFNGKVPFGTLNGFFESDFLSQAQHPIIFKAIATLFGYDRRGLKQSMDISSSPPDKCGLSSPRTENRLTQERNWHL
jgi:hypothetical protein